MVIALVITIVIAMGRDDAEFRLGRAATIVDSVAAPDDGGPHGGRNAVFSCFAHGTGKRFCDGRGGRSARRL